MSIPFYVGTYTDYPPAQGGRKESIFLGQMDTETGRLEINTAQEGGPNASFLAMHPSRRWLYAANELADGAASALEFQDGVLRLLNSQPVQGADPCYLSVDPSGRWLLAACYSSGSLSVLPVQSDGRLGTLAKRLQHEGSGPHPNQEKAHVHSAMFDPSGRFLLSADLGMDRVWIYRLDGQNGQLETNDMPWLTVQPGAGPRHLAFHPSEHWLYISNELNSTVTACAWDGRQGRLEAVQTLSTLPEGFSGENAVADIHLTPSGNLLYVSNRGDNSLAAFRVDAESGRLEMIGTYSCGGNWPRNFAIDPGGRWVLVANQRSENLAVLRIEPDGGLAPTGQDLAVPAPVFVMFA